MSQTGKRFLSGLMNRVFRSNDEESRAAAKRRERSLDARRLGMEALEDRQLLAADPTLGAAVAASAEVAPSDLTDEAVSFQLDAAETLDAAPLAATVSAAPDALETPVDATVSAPLAASDAANVAVGAGTFEETTFVAQSESFQTTVDVASSNATLDDPDYYTTTNVAGYEILTDLTDSPVSTKRDGKLGGKDWAAVASEMLVYAGWAQGRTNFAEVSDASEVAALQFTEISGNPNFSVATDDFGVTYYKRDDGNGYATYFKAAEGSEAANATFERYAAWFDADWNDSGTTGAASINLSQALGFFFDGEYGLTTLAQKVEKVDNGSLKDDYGNAKIASEDLLPSKEYERTGYDFDDGFPVAFDSASGFSLSPTWYEESVSVFYPVDVAKNFLEKIAAELANGSAVGLEVGYWDNSSAYDEEYGASRSENYWLTVLGFEYNTEEVDDNTGEVTQLTPSDPKYYKSIIVLDSTTGRRETYSLEWVEKARTYRIVGENLYNNVYGGALDPDYAVPYINSFTVLQRNPDYVPTTGVKDAYETNDSAADVPYVDPNSENYDELRVASHLGKVDKTDDLKTNANGNVTTLSSLSLYNTATSSDLVDYYRFTLERDASGEDYVQISYDMNAQYNAPLKISLYKANKETVGDLLATGESSATSVYREVANGDYREFKVFSETISLAGIKAGDYYIKVEFADSQTYEGKIYEGAEENVSQQYSLIVRAGSDDKYETNNSKEVVDQATAGADDSSNLGVIGSQGKSLTSLVLRQYSGEESESDWYRFVLDSKSADFTASISYGYLPSDASYGRLNFYLYRENANGEAEIVASTVGKSVKTGPVSLSVNAQLDAGVYYVKVVGYRAATNVSYKLSINPGVSSDKNDAGAVAKNVAGESKWADALVVATDAIETYTDATIASETTIPDTTDIYLNYGFTVAGASGTQKVAISVYVGGENEKLTAADLAKAIDYSVDTMGTLRLTGIPGANEKERIANLKKLFAEGLELEVGTDVRIENLCAGKMRGDSIASKFDHSEDGAFNSISFVINEENFDLGAFYETGSTAAFSFDVSTTSPYDYYAADGSALTVSPILQNQKTGERYDLDEKSELFLADGKTRIRWDGDANCYKLVAESGESGEKYLPTPGEKFYEPQLSMELSVPLVYCYCVEFGETTYVLGDSIFAVENAEYSLTYEDGALTRDGAAVAPYYADAEGNAVPYELAAEVGGVRGFYRFVLDDDLQAVAVENLVDGSEKTVADFFKDAKNVKLAKQLTKEFIDAIYVVKAEDSTTTSEFRYDNNVSTARFVFDNFGDDSFVANGSVSDVEKNTNVDENPNLGAINAAVKPNADGSYSYTIGGADADKHAGAELAIVGKLDADGEYLEDWLKFELREFKDGADNYQNASVTIHISPDKITGEYPDLDLYLYRVDADGSLQLVGEGVAGDVGKSVRAKGEATETVYFDSGYGVSDGTYFVRVVGFGGESGRYTMTFDGFTAPGEFAVPELKKEFVQTEARNGVATVDWTTALEVANEEAKAAGIEYYISGFEAKCALQKDLDAAETEAAKEIVWANAKTVSTDAKTTEAKFSGLEANAEYAFRVTVKVGERSSTTDVDSTTTENFMNEVVYRAILVGYSDQWDSDSTYAANDVEAFRDQLLTDGLWASDNITVLTDSAATVDALKAAFKEVAKVSDDNDVFVFYFAGEGKGTALSLYGEDATLTADGLRALFNQVAAGTKNVILDAGQVGAESTSYVDYSAFLDSLTEPDSNGNSERAALTSAITAGKTTKYDVASGRSSFSLALVGREASEGDAGCGMKKLATTGTYNGRISFADLYDDLKSNADLVKLGVVPQYETTDLTAEAILTCGDFAERSVVLDSYSTVFDSVWAAENAIVVTSSVDSVDRYDGVVSLREAAEIYLTSKGYSTVRTTTALKDGARLTLGAGSSVTIGTRTGETVEPTVLEYANGSFKTVESCVVVLTGGKETTLAAGTVLTFAPGSSLTDESGATVEETDYVAYASYDLDATDASAAFRLDESSVLYTNADKAKGRRVHVEKVYEGDSAGETGAIAKYRLYDDEGVEYTKTTGLYYGGSVDAESDLLEVKIVYGVDILKTLDLTDKSRIVFSDAVAGETATVRAEAGAIDFGVRAIVDATSLNGSLTFSGKRDYGGKSEGAVEEYGPIAVVKPASNATDEWSGVSFVGFRFKEIQTAFVVEGGASFELANSLVSDCVLDASNNVGSVIENDGTVELSNDTFDVTLYGDEAKKTVVGGKTVVSGSGSAKAYNSIFAAKPLGEGSPTDFVVGATVDRTDVVTTSPNDYYAIFLGSDAKEGEEYYSLRKGGDAVDRGDSSRTRLQSGVALDYDLIGNDRVLGIAVDAGAFEYKTADEDQEKASTVVTILEDVVDPTDGEISLREALQYAGKSYRTEIQLADGAIVTTAKGDVYQVEGGELKELIGVYGELDGLCYAATGVYLCQADLSEIDLVEKMSGSTGTAYVFYGDNYTERAILKSVKQSDGTYEYRLVKTVGGELTAGEKIRYYGTDEKGAIVYYDGVLAYESKQVFANGAEICSLIDKTLTLYQITGGAKVAYTLQTGDVTGYYHINYNPNVLDGISTAFSATIFRITSTSETTDDGTTVTYTYEKQVVYFDLPEETKFLFAEELSDVADNDKTIGAEFPGESTSGALYINLTERLSTFSATAATRVSQSNKEISSNPTVVMEDGEYTLDQAALVLEEVDEDGNKVRRVYKEGALFTLDAGVFYFDYGLDSQRAVAMPTGTSLCDAGGVVYEFAASLYRDVDLEVGSEVTYNGKVYKYGGGATVYSGYDVGTTITFSEELRTQKNKTITLDANFGALAVYRAVTFDAASAGGLTIDAQNASRVLTVDMYRETSSTATTVLTGLTLKNGSSKDASVDKGGLVYVAKGSALKLTGVELTNGESAKGGAIYNGGTLTIENGSKTTSKISDASAEFGGAIYNDGTLSLSKTDVADANATADGGAIYNVGTATLNGVSFAGVSATANGGAIYNAKDATVKATNAKFDGATATANGGAIYNVGTATLSRNSEIANASATNGGAIYNAGALTVEKATISASKATANGGAIYNADGGETKMTGAKVFGNSARYGGAIYDAAKFFATQTVFAANEATEGAAVCTVGFATLVNSLVEANKGGNALVADEAASTDATRRGLFLTQTTVHGNAGGIVRRGSDLVVYNSIVGGSKSGVDLSDEASSGAIETAYSAIQTASASVVLGVGCLTGADYNPSFRNVAGDDWTQWDLRVKSDSCALDAANADYAYYIDFAGNKVVVKNDFAGNTRPGGTAYDMGAYEAVSTRETASTVVTTLEDVYDPYDGLVSLREAIANAALGTSEAERTVTFSSELFPSTTERETIYLNLGVATYEDELGGTKYQNLGALVLSASVTVTTAYTNDYGETEYYDLAIDGRNATTLFVKQGDGEVVLRGLTLTNGKAEGDLPSGGAIQMESGSLSLVDCVVVGNEAETNGGAIYQTGGAFFAANTLFYDNVAGRFGGAFFSTGGQTYLYNDTIARNDAAIYGGVMSQTGLITIANSIVAENGGAQNADLYAMNLNAFANLIGSMEDWYTVAGLNGNYVGTPLSPISPEFVGADLATSEMTVDSFKLKDSSFAINAGLNEYANGPDGVRLQYDLVGSDRIIGGVVDMGALESGAQDVKSTVVTTLSDVVASDGKISLREAIANAQTLGTTVTFDLGENFDDDAIIYLEGDEIVVDFPVAIDASALKGGLTIFGDSSRIFRLARSADDAKPTSLTLTNVALTGGDADGNGGAILIEDGSLSATNCVVYGNAATGVGGAIYAVGSVDSGDGYTGATKIELLNSTIAGNSAPSVPGLYFGNAAGEFSLQNSIIADNASVVSSGAYNVDLYVTAANVSATASLVEIGSDSFREIYDGKNGVLVGSFDAPVDPLFGERYSLTASSPALNKGSNRLIGRPGYYSSILLSGSNVRVITTDFAGDARVVGGTVDMGAYEYQTAAETPSVTVTTLEDVVDPFDGKISLREAVDYASSAYVENGLVCKVGTKIDFASNLAGGKIALKETLKIEKGVWIDASNLNGGLTVTIDSSADDFGVFEIDSKTESVALIGLTITGGIAANGGAGVFQTSGDLALLNCLIYGNESPAYGAGVRVASGTTSVVNTTITKNVSETGYAGLFATGGTISLKNSLIAKNLVGANAGVDMSVSKFGEVKSTLVGSATDWVARKYAGVDANLFGTAANPVDPSFTDWEKNDFSLGRDADGFNSVAMNAGDNLLAVYPDGTVSSYDAQGQMRVVGGTVDMGALESPNGPTEIPSLIVTTAEDVVDPYDGLISLREAVAYANNYGLSNTITFAESINGSTIVLASTLVFTSDFTIDGLAAGAKGIVLTLADSVSDASVLRVDSGDVVLNGLTITNRRSERLEKGLDDLTVAEGGAIYVRDGSINLYNCWIYDCAAAKGSAIALNAENSNVLATLVNCTIVDNYSKDELGAAIYASSGKLVLENTIVALNMTTADASASDVYCEGATASGYNSYVAYSDSFAAQVSGNGCFVGCATVDLTAETAKLFVDPDNANYRLTDDGLATNAGDQSFLNQGTFNGTFDSYDLDRNRRVYLTTVDMGAFENQTAKDSPIASVSGTSIRLNVTTNQDVVNASDGETSLREALSLAKRLYALGYANITIECVSGSEVPFTLGDSALKIEVPLTIEGNNMKLDCEYANSAFVVETSGAVTIENMIITGGNAQNGGGIQLLSGDLTLVNLLIYDCQAAIDGGAIYSESYGKLQLYSCTIAKNVAANGCGIYGTPDATVGLYNSIVATNRSSDSSAIPVDVVFGAEFSVANSIIGNAGTERYAETILARSTDSLVGYGLDASVDPMFVDPSKGDFRLNVQESPAKQTGDPSYRHADHDLRGTTIAIDNFSMGAYQVGVEDPSTVVTTAEDVVDAYDGLISLREAINYAQKSLRADCVHSGFQAGSGHLPASAYNATNAMNDASVYSGTYNNVITFDKSLAGKTIVLKADDAGEGEKSTYGTLTFNTINSWTNSVTDYIIDASDLSELGGITIDASALGGSGWGSGSATISVEGSGDETNNYYWPVHVDIRNVEMVGSGGTGISANKFGMVTLRNCLMDGFRTSISLADDDSDDGAIAHVYSSTLTGGINVEGVLYAYNSIILGSVNIADKTTDPAYRQAYYYNSYIGGTGGLSRHNQTDCVRNSAEYGSEGLSVADLFVDYANGDYRLKDGSPCINTGNNEYRRTLAPEHADPEVDANGNTRVLFDTIDMGCYENKAVSDKPSTVVTTEKDVVDYTDGLISIREALAYAEMYTNRWGNTVTFDASLSGKTIVLTEGALKLTRDVKFDGGENNVTIDGNGADSIFEIAISASSIYANLYDVQISNLKLTNGFASQSGGAISIESGNVKLSNLWIYGNKALSYGGAVYAYDSELTLVDCRIGGNTAAYYGGVVNQFGKTILTGCYIAENVGTTQSADVWGTYAKNYSHCKNNVIGYAKDITVKDGVDGNRVGTETKPLKPFVNAKKGDLTIKSGWDTTTSGAVLESAFALFADDESEELAIDFAGDEFAESGAFDDDLLDSIKF